MVNNFLKEYVSQVFRDENEIEIILYGFKLLGTNFLTSIIILLAGIFIGQPISALIYLCVLILLRRNTGGYHSQTYLGCIFVTLLNFLIIIFAEINLNQSVKEIIGIFFIVYSSIKIHITIPHAHNNRVVNKKTLSRCNLKKNINLSIILFVTLLLHILANLNIINSNNYFFVISSCLMIVALSIGNNNLKEEEI